jgi:hypothetical protein
MIKMTGLCASAWSAMGVGDMGQKATMLGIQVAVGAGDDAEEADRAAAQLRRELLGLDIGAVGVPGMGAPPPGSKGVDVATVGALVVGFTDPQVLVAIMETVRAWLAGAPRRTIKMELGGDMLEMTGVSSTEQRRLADEWLARHAVGS